VYVNSSEGLNTANYATVGSKDTLEFSDLSEHIDGTSVAPFHLKNRQEIESDDEDGADEDADFVEIELNPVSHKEVKSRNN
jgi:hypothetical protein